MPSLVEIGPVVFKKKIFKFRQDIFTISLLSPLGKGRAPTFEQSEIPFTRGCFVPSLVKIGPMAQSKKAKVYRQMDGQTDRRRTTAKQAIKKAHLSFQFR